MDVAMIEEADKEDVRVEDDTRGQVAARVNLLENLSTNGEIISPL